MLNDTFEPAATSNWQEDLGPLVATRRQGLCRFRAAEAKERSSVRRSTKKSSVPVEGISVIC
jgi:hypothetical protein